MKPETVHHVAVSSRRPAHYRSDWNEQTMKTALESVLHCGMNISMAARTYNIPKSTLYDHEVGNVLPGTKSGHPTVLNKEEEEELVSFLIECAEIGFPRTRLDVIAMAEMVVAKKEDRQLTNGWWQGFCKRHSFLSYKNPTILSIARAHASSQATLQKYFQLLGETMIKYGLNNDPPLIFNMDESGFPLDPKPPKGVFFRGEKNPCSVTAGNKSQITVVGCVSASGQCLPPKPELAFGEVPGTVYGLVQRGWMTQQLFKCWFERHFLRYAPAARPLLLLLDGHSSHYCPETLKLAQQIQPTSHNHLTRTKALNAELKKVTTRSSAHARNPNFYSNNTYLNLPLQKLAYIYRLSFSRRCCRSFPAGSCCGHITSKSWKRTRIMIFVGLSQALNCTYLQNVWWHIRAIHCNFHASTSINLPLPFTFHFHQPSTSIHLPFPSTFHFHPHTHFHTHALLCMRKLQWCSMHPL